MRTAFVLDVSACIPWCCEDEATPATTELLDWAARGSELYVCSLWPWEIMNAVATAVKRQRIIASRAEEFLAGLGAFNIRVDHAPDPADFLRLFRLSQRHGLTAYDVAYLDLAMRLAVPLATLDGDLRKAALAEHLEVIGL